MKRRLRFFVSFILFFLTLTFLFSASAFSNEAKPENKIYRRIISLTPSTTEILFSLGLDEEIVGVTTFCRHPEAALQKPKVGGYVDHNLEAIMELKPDLVVLSANRGTKFVYEKLNQIGVENVAVLLYSLKDLMEAYRVIGEKVGRVREAEDWIRRFQDAVSVFDATPGRSGLKVAYVNWHYPLLLAGGSSLEGDILRLLGVNHIARDSPGRYPKWNMEALLAAQPDVIIDASVYGMDAVREKQKEAIRRFWKPYQKMKTLKDVPIYIYQTDIANVPGPRTLELIEAVQSILGSGGSGEGARYYEKI